MRWPLLLSVLALALSGCQDEQAEREALARLAPLDASPGPATATPTASPSATGTAAPGGASASRCTNDQAAYTVAYPQEWVTNAGEPDRPPCTLFDPERIGENGATDVAAIMVAVESVAFAEASTGAGSGEVRNVAVSAVGGLAAVRLQTIASGSGPLPAGTRQTIWIVDLRDILGGETVLRAATDDAGAADYARRQEVLDEMMESLRFTTTQPSDVILRVIRPEAFRVTAHRREGRRVCLGLALGQRIFTDCTFRTASADGISAATLAPVAPVSVTAGTVGEDVGRVDVELNSGRVISSVPRAIPEGGFAYAAPVDLDRVREVRAIGRGGRVIGRVRP